MARRGWVVALVTVGVVAVTAGCGSDNSSGSSAATSAAATTAAAAALPYGPNPECAPPPADTTTPTLTPRPSRL
jgi:hypothetical protein